MGSHQPIAVGASEAMIGRRGVVRLLAAAALAVPGLPVKGDAAVIQVPAGSDRDPLTVVLDDLIAANRILANEGVIDAFGHVSARHPSKIGHFLMSRARAPALVEAADLMEFAADGTPVAPGDRHPYIERFIHAGVYAARPDVRSVVHDHSAEIIPFGISSIPLRAISHIGGMIGEGVPVWDIAEVVGPNSNMLVTNLEVGRSLAHKLGRQSAVLMRGHGATVAGGSIRQATIAAVMLNAQARMLQSAIALGGSIRPLSTGEVAAAARIFSDETPGDAIGRTWEYWCARARVAFHPHGA